MALKTKLSTKVSQLRKMFREIDEDRSGTITKDEIFMAFRNQNIQVDSSIMDRIVEKIDFDGDGNIRFLQPFLQPFQYHCCSLLLISPLTHAHLHAHTFSLDELARYFENLEPAELPGLGGNLIWDSKARRKVNIPHKTAASINSDADRPDHHSDAGGIVVDVTSVGGFIADLGTGRGQSVDLFELVRNKIYRKYKTTEFFNAIRIACMANKDTHFEQTGATEGMLSLELLRVFLYRSCGLRLTPAAFNAFVKIFDKDGSGMIELSHFGQMLVGHDYPSYIAMPSEKAAAAREEKPGLVPAPPKQPRNLEAYGVRSGDPVELARYLICQRAGPGQNSHRMGPRRRLRDAFNRADPAGDGCVDRSDFSIILKNAFNIEMDESSWAVFNETYKYTRPDGRVNYNGFLKEVLETDPGGHYHPHMGRQRGQVIKAGPGKGGRPTKGVDVVMDASLVDLLKKIANKVDARKKNIGHVFRELDQDKSGALEPAEFKLALKQCLGIDLEQADFDRLMACLDRDGDGVIDYHEFVGDMADIDHRVGHILGDPRAQQKIMASVFKKGADAPRQERVKNTSKRMFKTKEELLNFIATKIHDKSKHIRKVYRSFDEDKNGLVSNKEFRFGLKQLGIDLQDEDFAMLISIIDADGNGHVNYQEFVEYTKFLDEQHGGFVGDPNGQEKLMAGHANASHKVKLAANKTKTPRRTATRVRTATVNVGLDV